MKTMTAAALIIATFAATPVLADAHMEAQAPAFSTDVPIETLIADERAKAVLMQHMGGQDVSQHPMYDQFKSMSLKAIAPFSQGMITDEMLEKIDADLAKIEAIETPQKEADEG